MIRVQHILFSVPALAFLAMSMPVASAQEQQVVEDVDQFSESLEDFPEEEVDPNVSGLKPIFAPVDGILPDLSDETSTTQDLDEEDDGTESGPELIKQPAVLLRGLDKISGRSTEINMAVGSNAMLGGLRVTVKACHQAPPTEPPESVAYVEVEDYGFSVKDPSQLPEDIDKNNRAFHGWMYASSPGLNGLEHPIYDVWVIRCMADVPDLSDAESKS